MPGRRAFAWRSAAINLRPKCGSISRAAKCRRRFISAQQLATDIPANFIAQSGGRIIEVRTPDGKFWSNQFSFNVQDAPRPQFQYIGMIARKRGNNDTAYFQETGKSPPFGRAFERRCRRTFPAGEHLFRPKSIFEDTSLGFRHRLTLFRPAPGTGSVTDRRQGQFSEPAATADFRRVYRCR